MFSTENISTYNKFKLYEGNLYMNNERVGIEEFHSGKNIEISNHLLQLSDNVNISGQLIVDNDVRLGGTLYASNLDLLEFTMYNPATISYLNNIDISTSRINDANGDLNINTRNDLNIDTKNDVSMNVESNFSLKVNDNYTLDSSGVNINSNIIYFNNLYIEKKHTETINGENITGEYLILENIKITNRIILPDNVQEGTTISGDFNVTGKLFSAGKLNANGINILDGTNSLYGTNDLLGTTTIEKGTFQDISISNLTVTSDCDVFLSNNKVFRITDNHLLNDVNDIIVYDWLTDICHNLYYDRGNIVIGNIMNAMDASLNVIGSVYIKDNVQIDGTLNVEGDVEFKEKLILYRDIIQYSDIRLKSNITDLENGMDVIRKLKPKIYDKNIGKTSIKEIGVIAQDLLDINDLSFAVILNEKTDLYAVNYNYIHMYSLLGIKELDKKIDTLNEKIDQLSQSIDQRLGIVDQKLNLLYNRKR